MFFLPPQKIRLPFTTRVMSHILSDVVSCHSYDLRIVGHLQQPCQDPVEKKKRGKSYPTLKISPHSYYLAVKKKTKTGQLSIPLDREEERAEESDDNNLSGAGADCRDRMLMEWEDQDFCWMSDGTNKSMWTEYKKKRLQEKLSVSTDWAHTQCKQESLCNQTHCWQKNVKHSVHI